MILARYCKYNHWKREGKYISAKFKDYSKVCFKRMSRRKGQRGGKQGSEVHGGLAVVRCPLQEVLRGLPDVQRRRKVSKSKRQNVMGTGVTKQRERAKPFGEKGSSEGMRALLVGKRNKKRRHQITSRQR